MSDTEKIRLLKTYREAVAKVSVGDVAAEEHYELRVEQLLHALLGRVPTEEELRDATWSPLVGPAS